jgi:hypothetical protein
MHWSWVVSFWVGFAVANILTGLAKWRGGRRM